MHKDKLLNHIITKVDIKKPNLIRTLQINNLNLFLILKNFIRVFFFKIKLRYNIKKNTNTIFVSTRLARKEILNSFKMFSNRFENKKSDLQIFNYTFEVKNLFSQIKIFLYIFKNIKLNRKEILYRIFLSLSYLEIFNLYLKLYKNSFFEKKIKHYIFMMEMQYYENVICQLANIQKKKTYSYAHALYRYSGKKISYFNVNPINYLASVSKFAFVWGLKHKEIIEKYTNQKAIVVDKKIKINKKFSNNIILLLESVKKTNLNLKMIKILKHAKLKFKIKAHPDDMTDYNVERHKDNNKFIPKTVFANDTTELFKYALNDCQMYIYKKSYFVRNNKIFFISSKIKDFKIVNHKKKNNFWKLYISPYITKEKIFLK